MLKVTLVLGLRTLFVQVYGNTPDLAYIKNYLLQLAAKEHGTVYLMIGDREDDLVAGRSVGEQTAFATWGHGELINKTLANHILIKPEDVLKVIK